jgi:cyclopropane fatty-acyl-phospholipid synthase-like methyltransferase
MRCILDYYEGESNIEEYTKTCEGFDGRAQIQKLSKYLNPKATVLEIGIGPGTDLHILNEVYTATGSDNSQAFLDRYAKLNPNSDLLKINAIYMDTERRFNGIFSNKVLHHLTRKGLKKSIANQKKILEKDGIILHTFWKGNKEEFMLGMRSIYYDESALEQLFKYDFNILELSSYKEEDDDDSICLIARKRT